MQSPSITHIRVGDFGCLDVAVPVLTYGSGSPVLSIVTGIHGQETAGLFVIERLVRDLPDLSGRLRIVLSANPLAQSLGLRTVPRDAVDLNRVFPGSPHGRLPEIIAHGLLRELDDSDLVVDIHSVSLCNPVMGVFAPNGGEAVRRRSIALLHAFGPAVIWQLDFGPEESPDYRGALAPELHQRGIPNFAVEMPLNHRLTAEDIEGAHAGLVAVMVRLGMLPGRPIGVRTIPIVRRRKYHAAASGLFFPMVDVMTEVGEGQPVGRIRRITTFEEVVVRAPSDGILLQIHDRAFVVTGDPILAMGTPV